MIKLLALLFIKYSISVTKENSSIQTVPRTAYTQHNKFVPYGTRPDFCFAKTPFMLGRLGEIAKHSGELFNLPCLVKHRYPKR